MLNVCPPKSPVHAVLSLFARPRQTHAKVSPQRTATASTTHGQCDAPYSLACACRLFGPAAIGAPKRLARLSPANYSCVSCCWPPSSARQRRPSPARKNNDCTGARKSTRVSALSRRNLPRRTRAFWLRKHPPTRNCAPSSFARYRCPAIHRSKSTACSYRSARARTPR